MEKSEMLCNTIEALSEKIDEEKASESVEEIHKHLEFIERRFNAMLTLLPQDLTFLDWWND